MNAPFDVSKLCIETRRLNLRPFRPTDSDDFQEYEIAVELKENGAVIGSVGLENVLNISLPDHEQGREIGYVLSEEYWGRGLMTEAAGAVIHYCFQVLNWDYIVAAHFETNLRSRRVIEKCGFPYVKNVMHRTRRGTLEDTRLYVLYNPCKEK